MKNKKEAVNRRNKKKFKKEKARRLRQKQARQERKAEKLRVERVDISQASDWRQFLQDDEIRSNPYDQMTVFPNEEAIIGRNDKPGLLSDYLKVKLEMILSLMNTGQVVPDHIGLQVIFSEEEVESLSDQHDISNDAHSLMGFPIKENYDSGLFSFQTLEGWGEALEESVREALALQERKTGKSLRTFGVWLTAVDGPFRQSDTWKSMGKGGINRRRPYAIRH